MKVFVTGATGYIGRAVVQAFRKKGHTVWGLVRQEDKAHHLKKEEIIPVIGELANPKTYQSVLNEVEVAIHCAFEPSTHGVSRDIATVDTILQTFSSSNLPKIFVYTSGIWVYGSYGNQVVDESTPLNPIPIASWRAPLEEKILKASNANLKTVVMRPGCVFGKVGGLFQMLFDSTKEGAVSIVGDGSNRWPLIHVDDLAHAYVSVVEKELGGVVLNVADDTTFTIREVAEAIAISAGMPNQIRSISRQEASKLYGKDLLDGIMTDLMVSNSRIKRLLGWQVHHHPFIHEASLYYEAWKSFTK